MASHLDFTAIRKDFDAFSRRINASRTAPTLEMALIELENAEEELRVCTEEIERLAYSKGDTDLQREFMSRAFQELPSPAFVLDDSGVIRGLNRRGAEFLGVTAVHAVGKPFAVFVESPWRATFRCELADVLREGRPGSLVGRVGPRNCGTPPLELRLARISLDDERPVVLITLDIFASQASHHDIVAEAAQLRRLDIMGRMTRLLLGAPAVSGPALLGDAVALLADECCDFAVIDLARGGVLRRAVVAGPVGTPDEPDGVVTCRALERLDPDGSPVARTIVETGESMLHIPVWEEGVLGGGHNGHAVPKELNAAFAAGVALRDETAGQLGVLLLIRKPDRPAFTLTDLALYEELGVHIGLALKR
ncbi:PAS domain-containing protein [Actinomadura rudentiformis]|uniref:PAS domain-containing protein n=1 Tax=Actinomadura rudentiformis TaxID=359158 RepID=A0A6H9YQS8_9ACTN|nr:PAS domain-containing protein [Actinomadura rudentiformis]KAB2348908.1 PAS domain-containing protein [Actinomadura rudentiformis]